MVLGLGFRSQVTSEQLGDFFDFPAVSDFLRPGTVSKEIAAR